MPEIKPGAKRGEGSLTIFNSTGSFKSTTLEQDVFVGIKRFKENYNNDVLYKDRFVFELAVMSVVAENLPHLLPELPLFYGLMTDKERNPLGIITEDITRNGRDRISPHAVIPRDLLSIFAKDTVDEDRACNVACTVYEKPDAETGGVENLGPKTTSAAARGLVDFYPLVRFEQMELHRSLFPEEAIEAEMSKYTVTTNFDQ